MKKDKSKTWIPFACFPVLSPPDINSKLSYPVRILYAFLLMSKMLRGVID